MKQLKKDLQGLSRELTALRKKTEKIATAIEKLEKSKVPRQRASKARGSSSKKAYAKRYAAGRKTATLTATDHIVNIINRVKKGVDVPTLIEKSGFEDKKVRNILARTLKQGRVSRVGRGIYAAREERRRHRRMDSLNLVSYTSMDNENQVIGQAMGRTLDVTEGGILLETHVPMDLAHTLSLTIGVKEDLVDVKGKVIHCRPGKAGRFQSGVQFTKMQNSSIRILKRFITAFKKQQQRL
ncbi:MAG: PilZ domain-containing protein [Thermodesulfobacteriota bacterium]|nr:PilZ domain-containing protein [Thermodesulfobacteriota bacterium]